MLLESMVEHGIDKIVFSSTAATYGEPESIPILETARTLPTNCYGETKLSMEKCLNGYLRHITYDMFHFGILTLVEHTRMENRRGT